MKAHNWFKKLAPLMIVLIFVMLTACQGKSASGENEPIKIGVLLTLSGPLSNMGDGLKKGIELYFEEKDYKIGERKVEFIYEDDENNPQVAIRKYRKLVDQDGVDLLLGVSSSTVLYALKDQIDRDKIPLIALSAGNEIAWEKKSDYIFRPSYSNWHMGYVPGVFAAKNLGKTAYVVSYENPSGYEQAAAFKDAFEENGGKVLKIVYPKSGTNDFATYLTEIAQLKPDVVNHISAGPDGMRFAMQYKEFGFKGKIPFLATVPADLATTPEMMDALEGAYVRFDYLDSFDIEENQKFVKAFKKKFGDADLGFEYVGYDAALYVDKAITKAKTTDVEKLINVLKDLKYESPRGEIQIDPKTHNPILDYYMIKYVLKDGKLVKEYLETIEDVQMPAENPNK